MQQRPVNQAERAEHADDNPALSDVIERNIRTIIQLRLKAAHARGVQDRLADVITAFSGRMVFVYMHIVWFGVWFLLNTGRFGLPPFDPFPYGLLTMVVSLEAIFLATFVLISQNRLSAEAEHRADYVFDLLMGNTSPIRPAIHSTDTHGTNEVNFALLQVFNYQFAPRYKNLSEKVRHGLYGFQHPSQYTLSMGSV